MGLAEARGQGRCVSDRAISAGLADPVVPSWWMTIEAAAIAICMASSDARPGGEGGGQVRGHGIAGPDDVDRASDWQRRDVLGGFVRAGADDPSLGEGHEDGLPVLSGEVGCASRRIVSRSADSSVPVIRASSAAFILKPSGG